MTVVSPGVGTPTGSVVFAGNGPTTYCTSPLSTANPPTATCTKTYAGAGNDSVTATYGGDTNDVGSTGTEMPTIGHGRHNDDIGFGRARPRPSSARP